MKESKYWVLRQDFSNSGKCIGMDSTLCSSKEEALEKADRYWNALCSNDQRHTVISAIVGPEDEEAEGYADLTAYDIIKEWSI